MLEQVFALDVKLFEVYLEHRVEPVTDALEPSMYAGSFDWEECLRPTGVRPYIKMAVMNVVAIHAEVCLLSKRVLCMWQIQLCELDSFSSPSSDHANDSPMNYLGLMMKFNFLVRFS